MHQTFAKPTPKIVLRCDKRKATEKHRREIKSAVFARDKGKCRCCKGVAHEMHELRFRSLGGKRSLENSIAVCNYRGRNCHRMLQTHVITAEPIVRNANGPIAFERDGKVWIG